MYMRKSMCSVKTPGSMTQGDIGTPPTTIQISPNVQRHRISLYLLPLKFCVEHDIPARVRRIGSFSLNARPDEESFRRWLEQQVH